MKLTFCVSCGSTEELHHHHIIPRADGGTDEDHNFITLCPTHHGMFHDRLIRPSAELVSKGLRAGKAKGVRLGPKNTRLTLRWIKNNLPKISQHLVPALIYYSYGYYVEDVVNIKWKQVSVLPLSEEYLEMLNKSVPESAAEDSFIIMGLTKERCTANNFQVALSRELKKFKNVDKRLPPITSIELAEANKILLSTDEYIYIPKNERRNEYLRTNTFKNVEIARTTEEFEFYRRTEVEGATCIPEDFLFKSHLDGIKFTDWLYINEKVSERHIILLYLSSLGFSIKELPELKWSDLINSHAPKVLKKECERIMELIGAQLNDFMFMRKDGSDIQTNDSLKEVISRLGLTHFPRRIRRKKKNGISIK